jgi:signal transduction histidine kinase
MTTGSSSPQSIQLNNHPFRFLLYLEWVLVAIALLGELLPGRLIQTSRYPLLSLIAIIGFGLMGLRLPTQQSTQKIIYTVLEFGLILLATVSGIRGLRLFPFLYLVLVMRSCLMFQLPGRLIITGIAFLSFSLAILHRVKNLGFRASPLFQERIQPLLFGFALISALLFGLVLIFVLLLTNALIAERQSRDELAIANAQLRDYALRVETLAMAQERNRIAREIHDSLGHSLTALNLQLEGALKLWNSNPDQAQTFLQQAKQLGSTALQEVRRSVAAMRTDPLAGRSLEEAIAKLCEDTHKVKGIRPQVQIHLPLPLSSEICTALYRITQEALTNIRKHSTANQITITLNQHATDLTLTIQDNGQGFKLDQNQTGFGLQGMRERTLALGGQFVIDSAPGKGCCIRVQIPTV